MCGARQKSGNVLAHAGTGGLSLRGKLRGRLAVFGIRLVSRLPTTVLLAGRFAFSDVRSCQLEHQRHLWQIAQWPLLMKIVILPRHIS